MLKKFLFLILAIISFQNWVAGQTTEEGDSIQYKRMKWFIDQRRFPNNDTIPLNAYWDAIEAKLDRSNENGFFLSGLNSWQPLGPTPGYYYISGWSQYGDVTGRCQSIYIDTERDATGNTIYVVGANGGLWKTTNAFTTNASEVTWTFLSEGVPVTSSGSFAIYPNTGQSYPIIYYGTGEDIDYTTQFLGVGIFKTTNDGQSWVKGSGLPGSTKVFKIAIKPSDPDIILAALGSQYYTNGLIDCGLYRSEDAGATWEVISGTEDKHCTDVIFSPADDDIVFLTGPKSTDFVSGPGFRKSTDGGESFTEITGNGLSIIDRSLIDISKSDPTIVWVLTVHNWGQIKLYKSTNSGDNFTQTPSTQTIATYPNFNSFIRISPYDPNIVFVGGINLWKTTDGGNTSFVQITDVYGTGSNSNVHPDQHNISLFPTTNSGNTYANRMVLTNDGGVYRSTNYGGSFQFIGHTLNTFEFYTIAVDPFNPSHVFGAALDNGLQRRGSGTNQWSFIAGGDYSSALYSATTPNNLVHIPCKEANMMYSTNGGTSSVLSDFYTGTVHSWVVPIVSSANGNFYTANDKVYKSTNNGQNWTAISSTLRSDCPIEQIAVSQSNPDYMYASLVSGTVGTEQQRLYRTTNGADWFELTTNLPNKRITSIEVDPVLNNEVLITISGFISYNFSGDHVFKSTNFGVNWTAIGGLEDVPVNDLIIRYTSCSNKNYIVATDIGIYNWDGSEWLELETGLPNAPCLNLQFSRLANKLSVATFGMGAWQVKLDGDIYVKDKLYLAGSSLSSGIVEIPDNIVVCSGGKLIIPSACTIKMASGKKITIENGGTILANSNAAITFTSISSTWNGIEVKGNSSNCVLKNCTFSNTSTPIVIDEGMGAGIPTPVEGILIYDCHFTNVPIEIIGRDDVDIEYCDWAMSSGTDAVIASGADNIYLNYNDIIYSSQVDNSSPIQLSLCDNATVTRSTITGADYPITISNGTSYVRYSDITTSDADESYIGIYLSNVGDGHLIANDISGYQAGYKLVSSSPNLLINNADGSNSNGVKTAIIFESSSPIMFPTVTEEEVIWDGGLNTLRNDASGGLGMYNTEGEPQLDYGYNTIVGETNIDGDYPNDPWYVRCNSWENDPPVFSVTGVTMNYSPTDCSPPDSRPFNPIEGKSGAEKEGKALTKDIIPPQPLIVDYGNGLIDTLEVSSGSIEVTADIQLFGSGNKEIYLGNFEEALDIFEDVVSTYQDSAVAIASLNRIFYCHNRMNSDSSTYNTLRTYFLSLASTHNTDTVFSKAARELSRKCLVKQKNYITAISEYEDVVENSTDSIEIQVAEISIIELYIVLNSMEGDALGFTGRLAHLKPSGIRDGMKKIREKMGRRQTENFVNIPKSFSLSQNYPNPFNPLTKINYAIPNATKVSLRIYDILGRLVKTLVNEFKSAGNYTVTFDGTSLASGVYFYRIEAGDFVDSKKMVLVK